MLSRRTRGARAGLAALLALALLTAGCADRQAEQLRRDVQGLQVEVRELKRSRAEHRARLEEMAARLRVIQDRRESALSLGARRDRGRREALPVIRLGPESTTGGTYSVVGEAARPEGVRPATPPSGGAPTTRRAPRKARRQFSVEAADRRGIEAPHRLPVAPLPPPSTAAPSAAAGSQQAERVAVAPVAGSAGGHPQPVAPRRTPEPTPTYAGEPSHRIPSVAAPSSLAAPADGPSSPPPSLAAVGRALQAADAAPQPPLAAPLDGAKPEYERAFRAFQQGEHSLAQRLFARFVQLHPRSDLTDNALYWHGEMHYKQGRYARALELFGQVVEQHPTGNKVPDSFLKIGLCYQNLGKPGAAKKILEQVRSIFPETRAAEVAAARLEAL